MTKGKFLSELHQLVDRFGEGLIRPSADGDLPELHVSIRMEGDLIRVDVTGDFQQAWNWPERKGESDE